MKRLCLRCRQYKPSEAFNLKSKNRSGFDTWCRVCASEAHAEYRSRYGQYDVMSRIERRPSIKANDPVQWSRLVCAHVEAFVSRRIETFERNTGLEAPPHVVALRQLAQSFKDEHPMMELPPPATCKVCGTRFAHTTSRGSIREYCDVCSTANERERQRRKNQRRAARQKALAVPRVPKLENPQKKLRRDLVEARKQIHKSRSELAWTFRLLGLKWEEVSDKFGLAGAGSAYLLAHRVPYEQRRRDRRALTGSVKRDTVETNDKKEVQA